MRIHGTGEWFATWWTALTRMRRCHSVWLVSSRTRKTDRTTCCTGVCVREWEDEDTVMSKADQYEVYK